MAIYGLLWISMEVSGGCYLKAMYFGLWIRRSLVRDQEVVPLLLIGYRIFSEICFIQIGVWVTNGLQKIVV